MLGIIGGSGLSGLAQLTHSRRQVMRTPFGEPSCALTTGQFANQPIVFLARHGHGHTIPPHRINFRANIWALREAGVTHIVAVATVGGIRGDCKPGVLAVPDQIIDYTTGRTGTFFEGADDPVTHIDFTEPYDADMRQALLTAAQKTNEEVIDGGVYGCTQGPRLETAAEIRRLERDGCDLVGMTAMPETALAREAGVPYACLAVVANYAAGLGDSRRAIALDAIAPVLDDAMDRAHRLLAGLPGF